MHGMQGLNNKKDQFPGLSKSYHILINTLLRLQKGFSKWKIISDDNYLLIYKVFLYAHWYTVQ